MEPARIPLLLRAFVVQRLRVRDRGHACATPAHYPGNSERAEICSRPCHRTADIELGVSLARESVVVAVFIVGFTRQSSESLRDPAANPLREVWDITKRVPPAYGERRLSRRTSPHVVFGPAAMFGDELTGI